MDDFKTTWDRFHANCVPMRWPLHDQENWVRFHSLPGSKRYADNGAERAIVLDRANTLARYVLGETGPCWLVQTRPHFTEEPEWWSRSVAASQEYQLQNEFQFRDEDGNWDVYAALTVWVSGRFDRLIMSIANDESQHTLWMSAESGAVFSPYDGGTDLFLPSQDDVNVLKRECGEWLSPRADGY